MASLRIYQNQRLRLNPLDFQCHKMFKIGNVGVAGVKTCVPATQRSSASPA